MSSLSKMTRSMSASAHAAARLATFPAPMNVAGSGLGRSWSMRSATEAPAACGQASQFVERQIGVDTAQRARDETHQRCTLGGRWMGWHRGSRHGYSGHD